MKHDIEIVSMTRAARPQKNSNGDKIMAHLTLRIGPMEMIGWALVQRENGYVTVWSPRLAKSSFNRLVTIVDHDVKKQVIKAAQNAFVAMSGNEWQTLRSTDGRL
jgi:hypothetical protein